MLYDGMGGMESPLSQRTSSAASPAAKRGRVEPVLGWHHALFGSLLAMVHSDLEWLLDTFPEAERSNPAVLLICPLQRVAATLTLVCDALFDKQVQVCNVQVSLHDAARGLTADVVHSIRHRRFLDTPDQYCGIQGCLKREYVCYTATHGESGIR